MSRDITWWRRQDRTCVGNAGRFTVCSLWPLGYRPIHPRGAAAVLQRHTGTLDVMPSFDVVSEVDQQEVRNAVDQSRREINTRFDFKNTNSEIDQNELTFTLRTVSEDRLTALRQVFEEKLVKSGVSLKGLDYGKIEEAAQNTVRQVATLKVGISSDKAREINKLVKEKGPKGVSSQAQGDAVQVQGEKAGRPAGDDRHAQGR